MQISRHWRMKAQRYRLEELRYEDAEDFEIDTDEETTIAITQETHIEEEAAVPAA